MQKDFVTLNLNVRRVVALPASAFPQRADAYVCDQCRRDITKHLDPARAHVWSPMGPERYQCVCGQRYLTGAAEWDNLGERERRRRIRQTFGLGLFLSVMTSIPGLLAYLGLHFVLGVGAPARVIGVVITALPFFAMQLEFWPSVAASIWRTRFSSRLP